MRPLNDALHQLFERLKHTEEVWLDCDEVTELLDQFSEAALPTAPPADFMPLVQQHLFCCPDCREEFEALLSALRALPDETATTS